MGSDVRAGIYSASYVPFCNGIKTRFIHGNNLLFDDHSYINSAQGFLKVADRSGWSFNREAK
jgi:hypothetical protein